MRQVVQYTRVHWREVRAPALQWIAGLCLVACGTDVTQVSMDAPMEAAGPPISVGDFALEGSRWVVAPDFEIDLVATGFQLPVGIAMIPNPGSTPDAPIFYVVELYGTIKVVRRSGAVSDYATGLLNFDPVGAFPGSGEMGLGGAVVDPTNGDLYVTLLYSEEPERESAPLYGAVERLTSTNGGLTAATRLRIMSLAPEAQGPRHQISNITFGPDGNLYVHVGDGFDVAAAQNLTQSRGKILRLTKNGGAVSRNPYWDPIGGISVRDYVFASGLSNPFGGAWRLSDEAHYFVENGPSLDRLARLAVGRNYGWDGSDESLTDFALFNWNPSRAPVNIAFVEEATFSRSGFPPEYEGRAYITQSGAAFDVGPGDPERKSITEWVIDEYGDLSEGARAIAFYDGEGASTAVALAAGPDGLYFSDFYPENLAVGGITARGANVFRLRYTEPPPPADCNLNGMPDEDELALGDDCNRNGVPDECDIATSLSADCNLNTLPDECEVGQRYDFDFSYGVQGFSLIGSSEWVDGALRLTPTSGGLGSVIHPPLADQPLQHLRAQFDFQIGAGSGADGMSFVVLDANRYSQGELFGEDGPGAGAIAIKLNTFDNGDGSNNIQVLFEGDTLGSYTPSFELRDHEWHTLRVLLDDSFMTVIVSSSTGEYETAFDRLPMPQYAPFVARLGFGARTGGYADEHLVDNLVIWASGGADKNDSGAPDVCECTADVDDGQGWGMPDGTVDVGDLRYFLDLYLSEAVWSDLDDGSGTGMPDGVVDRADLEYFLSHFDGGC